jgi:hypothetical protein
MNTIVRRVQMVAACLATLLGARAATAQTSHPHEAAADSAAIVTVAERFHSALAEGDSAGVDALLSPSATVIESGEFETRTDYLRHHLSADIAFTRAVRGTRLVRRVTQDGSAAWIVSTSRSTGTFNGRPVDSEGAELMVLTRGAAGWHIAAIHWSSHRKAP